MIPLAGHRRKLRHLRQVDQMSCGPTCLRMITGYYGFHLDIYEADSLAEKTKSGVTLSSLVTAANSLGLQSKALLCSPAELAATDAPWLLHWRDNHFVVCRAKGPGKFLVNDPAGGMPITMDEAELRKNWANHSDSEGLGIAVLMTPDPTRFQRKSLAQDPFLGLRTIARDASAYRQTILTVFALVLICMALFLSIPILSRNMVVFGLGAEADHSLVAMLFVAQAAALILHEALGLARTTRALNVAASLGRNILTRFFRNFLATPLLEIESRNTGDFLSRVNDQNKLRLFIGTHAMSAVFEALLLVTLSIFVATHGTAVFISFTAGLGLGLVFFGLSMGKVMRANYRLINADGQTRSIEYEMIEGFTDLKITNTGENILNEWQKRQQLLNEIEHEITITEARQRSLTMVTFAITSVLVNYHLVIGVSAGRYGFGDLVAVNMAVAFCSQALMSLINFVQRGQEAWHSMTRLTAADRMANDPSGQSDTALPSTADLGALSACNLSFRFPGADDRPVLQDISLSVAQGETLAIVGESGSGKTTLLKLLMHLYRPTEGDLFVGGFALSEAQADLWRATCGAVLQDGFLFSDTLRHNVSMSFGQRDDDVDAVRAALRTACLEEFVAALPFGLDTKMGQEGLTPSGGQTQRILLARAVYGKPRILFLDEATSALDASVERRIVENLKRDCPEMTKIIVAHRLSTVVHANSIIVLKDGRIVEKGSHRDLVGNRSHYHRLVSDQLQLAS